MELKSPGWSVPPIQVLSAKHSLNSPRTPMNKRTRALPLLITVFFLSACGGGGDDSEDPPVITPTQARGDLLESPPTKLASYSTADLIAAVEGTDEGQEFLLRLALDPQCTVDVHQLEYRTVDPAGDFTPASGALMIPNGPDDTCRGARPIILYAHGTSTDRVFNIADLPNNGEG